MNDALNWYQALDDDPDYWSEQAKIEFAVAVERRLRQLALSKSDFAQRIGTSAAYVTKVLRGDANVTIETMAKLAYGADSTLHLHVAPRKSTVKWLEVYSRAAPPHRSESPAIIWAEHAKKRALNDYPAVAA